MLMDESLKRHIEALVNAYVLGSKPLSGGDTASVLKLETSQQASYVLKYSHKEDMLKVFEAEAYGLKRIASTNTIATPKVMDFGVHNGTSYLLMGYIVPKSPRSDDYYKLFCELCLLHHHSSEQFGLDQDNYIGSLEQQNTLTQDWIDFYSQQRLAVQLQMAYEKRLLNANEIPALDDIKSRLQYFCKGIKPSLLHGDLWNGNFIIGEDGTPYLIDPSVYYGHSEIDIAMSKLFGGFSSSFYEAYHQNRPIAGFYNERMDLYQLYYLLVHLNMFGRSYYASVKRILKSYF